MIVPMERRREVGDGRKVDRKGTRRVKRDRKKREWNKMLIK